MKFLSILFISPNRLKDKKYVLIVSLIFAICILIAYKMSMHITLASDFAVFWRAGINFTGNLPLYSQVGGTERYIYPPFAAMLFQIFGLFNLNVAGGIWAFINILLGIATVYVTRELLYLFNFESKSVRIILFWAIVLSFRFFWYHIIFMQMNLLVLFLSLYSFLLFLKKKEWTAVICLVISLFIKVLPIIFLFWMLTKSNYKAWIKTIIVSLICIVLPLIWRGFNMGIKDIHDYYISFLEPFQNGRVEPKLQNYSLSAAIYKWFVNPINPSPYFSSLFNSTIQVAANINRIVMLCMIIAYLTMVLYTRFIIKKISLFEVSFILLFTHLFSGITWEYHLVSLLFIYALFLLKLKNIKSSHLKYVYYFILILIIINGFIGLDTVGKQLYYMSCGYNFLTLLMIILLIDNFIYIFKPFPGGHSHLLKHKNY